MKVVNHIHNNHKIVNNQYHKFKNNNNNHLFIVFKIVALLIMALSIKLIQIIQILNKKIIKLEIFQKFNSISVLILNM